MDWCHEMSQWVPTMANVTAATEHQTYQGTFSAVTEWLADTAPCVTEWVADTAFFPSLFARSISQKDSTSACWCYAWGMARYQIEHGRRAPGSRATRIVLLVLLVILLFSARTIASYVIEIQWWKELGQFKTWLGLLYYAMAPPDLAIIEFIVFRCSRLFLAAGR